MADPEYPLTPPDQVLRCYAVHTPVRGYAMSQWKAFESRWVMPEDRSGSGTSAGTGPTQPGRFDGQVVRWASVPSAG